MSYNLWEKPDVINILLRDKFKILEGICAEQIFVEDILPRKGWNNYLSTGWWAVPKPNAFGDYILFKVTNKTADSNDIKIFNLLIKKNIEVYFVMLDKNNNLNFLHINKSMNDLTNDRKYMDLTSFLNYINKNTSGLRAPLLALENVRSETKQMRAIKFLEERGQLFEVGLQRYFANFILTVYFGNYIVNLDGFLIKDNSLMLYEVKFKYPAGNNKFGLNKGFINLFRWFLKKGISIYHFILYNGTHDENITVLDAIDNMAIKEQCKWLFCEITNNHLIDISSLAPSKTQIEGKSLQKVTYIDSSDFTFIKKLL